MPTRHLKRSLPNLVRLTLTAVMLAVAMLGSWSPAAASDHVEPGFVPLSTRQANLDIGVIPIGNDFFFPGSQQPVGSLTVIGLPFDTATYGDASIQFDIPSLEHDPGTPVSGPATITQFGLGPIDPIVIRNADGSVQQEWIFQITLSPLVPQMGTLNVLESHPNGGSFSLELPLVPRFTFTNVDNNETRELDFGLMTQPFTIHLQGSSNWSRICPDRLHVPGQTSNFCPGTIPTTGDTFPFPLRDILNGSIFMTVERTAGMAAPNRPPVLDPVGNLEVVEEDTLFVPLVATDPDGDQITLSAPNLPGFGALTDSGDGTGFLEFSPTAGDDGTYTLAIIATDGGDPPLSTGRTFILTVSQANRPPELEPIGPLEAREGTTTTFTFTATDPDGDNLIFSIQNAPSYSQLIDNGDGTAAFSVTPPLGSAPGTSDVTVTVMDDGDPPLSEVTTFQLTLVTANNPPALDPIGDLIVTAGGFEIKEITASDPDGHSLTFGSENLPAFCTLTDHGNGTATLRCDPASGEFPFDEGDAGRYPITIFVTDSGLPPLSDSETFTLLVNISVLVLEPTNSTLDEEFVPLSASSPTPGVEFSWDFNNDGVFDDAFGEVVQYSLLGLVPGFYPVKVRGCVDVPNDEPICNEAETGVNLLPADQPEPSFDNLRDLTRDYVDNQARERILVTVLYVAELLDRLGLDGAVNRTLDGYIRLVQLYTPRWISQENAQILIDMAEALKL